MKRWANVRAIYQIYPRSFLDTDANGVGDINGVTKKLDYLKSTLGVDAVWLSPFYPSPMADFGYDIKNYIDVDSIFGTIDDFRMLLREAHSRNMKIMIDFVPNHTSDEHSWFKQSRQSKSNSKRDWYVWRDPSSDGGPPNNWLSVFGGSAWTYDNDTQQYYLHSFLYKQPDLNWENPEVRKAMFAVLDFWLDLGVDGIRADAVRWISKDRQFRNNPLNTAFDPEMSAADIYHSQIQRYSQSGTALFTYLNDMAAVIKKYEDRIIIFEQYPDDTRPHLEQYQEFYDKLDTDVGAPFLFEGMFLPYESALFRDFIYKYQTQIGNSQRLFYCFGNHDQSRLVTRFGGQQARLIALLQLTLPGTPVIYYGEEIGMEDGLMAVSDIKDPFELQSPGRGLGRDPERTPMQWTTGAQAGFSRATPWLPVQETHKSATVSLERGDNTSFLTLYRRLLVLRKKYPQLMRGKCHVHGVDERAKNVISYEYSDGAEVLTIIANMSDGISFMQIVHKHEILASTHDREALVEGAILLRPHEGVVLRRVI